VKKLSLIIVGIAVVAASIVALQKFSTQNNSAIEADTACNEEIVEEVEPEVEEYGIVANSYNVLKKEVGKNEFLGEILQHHNVPFSLINAAANSKEIFDVRKFRSGNNYAVFTAKNDTNNKADYFVYEPNKESYIIYDFTTDSLQIQKIEREKSYITQAITGVVTSSLYESIVNTGYSPELAVELANIFEWSIDFYKIQNNDRFKVIFEQKYIEDEPAGISKIFAANFMHHGNDFYAFEFHKDSLHQGGYYDENGGSQKKAFLQTPLKFGRLTSRYTLRRFHPVQKRYKAHLGTDYAAPRGTPIRATGDGVVIAQAYGKYNGRYVKIRHNKTYTTQYLHMNGFAKGVKKGSKVTQGQTIGYVGSTGLATGPHVCYRFWKNNKQVDSRKEVNPPAEPLTGDALKRFYVVRDNFMEQMNAMQFEDDLMADSKTKEGLDTMVAF